VVEVKYYGVQDFKNGFAVVQVDRFTFAIIDKNGNELFPAGTYQNVMGFSKGLAAVRENNRWGYIDTEGNIVIPTTLGYSERYFVEGMAAFQRDGRWGFITLR
jgi:hypothetical protein